MTSSAKPPRIASLDDLPPSWRGGVVAIGNFDGVHRGHQAVLAAARAEAERRNVACIMLTFEPHPRAFFSGRPLYRLTPAPLKAALAGALGLDGTLILPFDRCARRYERRGFRPRRAGRPARPRRRRDGLRFPFRQGAPRHAAIPAGRGRPARLRRDRHRGVHRGRRARLLHPHPHRFGECRGRDGERAARLALCGRRHRDPRRGARPRARLPDREHGARPGRHARPRHLCRALPARRRAALRRRGELWQAADFWRGQAAARDVRLRFFRRSLRRDGARLARRPYPPRAALRQRGGAGRPHGPGFARRAGAPGAASAGRAGPAALFRVAAGCRSGGAEAPTA